MCGIIGYVSRSDRETDGLESSTLSLAHRGPDDMGIHRAEVRDLDGNVYRAGIGHRRLSILDLSDSGHQPMSSASGSIWITYNGEIYNYRSLRSELVSLGHTFRSETDTEVLISAYEQWGIDCLNRLDGMFAFAIVDQERRRVLLARDRLGIKPIYIAETDEGIAFASEVKALMSSGFIQASPNWDVLLSHLSLLWSPGSQTAFDGVRKLPPGHYAVWEEGSFDTQPYWDIDLESGEAIPGSGGTYVDHLDELLKTSVENRMVSDVPIGSLLSGGLDSSLISAMMAKSGGQPDTYAIAFRQEDQKFEKMSDDRLFARKVANHIGSKHTEIEIGPDVADLLPAILWHLEEPIGDPAAINTYLISRAARERGTKVLLSGMGADEILGGYRKHLSVLIASLYKRLCPRPIRESIIHPLVQSLPSAGSESGFRWFRWAKRFEQSASLPDMDCFLGNSSYFPWGDLDDLIRPEWKRQYEETYAVRRHGETFRYSSQRDLLTQMSYSDTKLFLSGLNLAYTDKSSMAASVEIRVPFLDHRLVEFALNLPSKQKIRGGTQKWLLRKVGYRYLPREVVDRPKAPFGAPLRSWMRGGLLPLVQELLSEESIKQRGYFHYNAVKRMIDANNSGREDYAHRLWGLLTIELWHRIFVDQEISPSFPNGIHTT